jgi:enolase-phosphatase E1
MKAILLDIEGTVSAKRFVHHTLFPYAREHMRAFLAANEMRPEIASLIEQMRVKLNRPGASREEVADGLIRWIDEDRKEEPLKTLQGFIWKEGYERGRFVSHLYPDVKPAIERWRKKGLTIAIFSSGSVGAAKLFFAHAEAGDLTPLLAQYFDLSTGPKYEAASYARIAKALDLQPAEIRFYSDAPKEVAAALEAGLEAVLVERDGRIDAPHAWRRITDFTGE